ncbi:MULTISPECIES: hypothetical protein [Pseudonocardia]|uniref:Uncharacterized protein n=1 Tax=Pseudonocardia alni TaxID=33907 RepID=A0A852VXH9_PSEA5|nr:MULTISPECIES: hypothetical protein [Pseudonocardia]MCO7191733.1 hypothetical protein [Pseudonocardia sp. McavD-2-B]NYG00839.1 hypothetical protein [Pseudonocardia antarctica]
MVDFGGVRLGRACADGAVLDDADVHIGRVRDGGEVVDHAGVHIGRVGAPPEAPQAAA